MTKSDRKAKWRNVSITPHNVDEYLEDLRNDTKGQFINQGVSINKDDPYQMGLLKLALLEQHSFSGFIKKLLADHFYNDQPSLKAIKVDPPSHIEKSTEVFVDNSSTTDQTQHINQPHIEDDTSKIESPQTPSDKINKPRAKVGNRSSETKITNPLLAK